MAQRTLLGVALALATTLTHVGLAQAAQLNQSGSVSGGIQSVMAVTDPWTLPAGANQPVGEAPRSFFCGSVGLDNQTMRSMHMDGFGYG